jgi:hypothetical protein
MAHRAEHPGDVSGLHPLNAVSQFKFDRVALADMQDIVGPYVGDVDINVLAIFGLDMTVSGSMVEPLDGSFEHGRPPSVIARLIFSVGQITIRFTDVSFMCISTVFVHRCRASI